MEVLVSVLIKLEFFLLDIVDIKPANMEELSEVITSAEFHPTSCSLFMYSSSKGILRLCDMRQQALCDKSALSELLFLVILLIKSLPSLKVFYGTMLTSLLNHQPNIVQLTGGINNLRARHELRECLSTH